MPIDYAPSYVTILGMVRAAGPLMPEPDEDTSSPDVDNPLKDLCQCVIYTRLSREDDKSHSPETQLYVCEECARRQGWKVLRVFAQDAKEPISGKAFDARPGWDALSVFLDSLPEKERSKTCVLVKAFDRFSRNLREGLETEESFRTEMKVRLRSTDNVYLAPETAEGWMTFVDLLKFAEWERKMIVKRTRDGLATAHRKGIHLGTMPRHFTKDDGGRIMPTSQAMEVVKLRSEGKSYTQIARRVGNVTRQEAFSICKYLVNELARGALN